MAEAGDPATGDPDVVVTAVVAHAGARTWDPDNVFHHNQNIYRS